MYCKYSLILKVITQIFFYQFDYTENEPNCETDTMVIYLPLQLQ